MIILAIVFFIGIAILILREYRNNLRIHVLEMRMKMIGNSIVNLRQEIEERDRVKL